LYSATRTAGLDAVQLVEGVLTVLLRPEPARCRVERHPKAVPKAVREDLLDVRADLSADRGARGDERVVGWRRAVVVQPQHDA
jgi:hypothetical protein